MADAFISYSRKNKEFVQGLNQTLISKQNKDTWVDWDDIKPGINFWNEIKAGIAHADSFISIISPDSMKSVMCHLEISYAIELGKRIVPIILEEIDQDEIFATIGEIEIDKAMADRLEGKQPVLLAIENWRQLCHINWIFFRKTDDFDDSFIKLIQAVETDIQYVKAHTRYLVRAQEWLDEGKKSDLLLFGKEIKLAEDWLQDSKKYEREASQEKVDIMNPLPGEQHREFITASRKAQKIRWRVGLITITSIIALVLTLLFVVVLASNVIAETQHKLDSLNQDIAQASETLNQQYASIAPSISDTEIARAYCTSGILLSEINREAVIQICDRAVELAPPLDKNFYRDFPGIARAQAGDLEGALEDFKNAYRHYQIFAKNCVEVIELREDWINDLEQGINPFDDPLSIDRWLHEPSLNECDTP